MAVCSVITPAARWRRRNELELGFSSLSCWSVDVPADLQRLCMSWTSLQPWVWDLEVLCIFKSETVHFDAVLHYLLSTEDLHRPAPPDNLPEGVWRNSYLQAFVLLWVLYQSAFVSAWGSVLHLNRALHDDYVIDFVWLPNWKLSWKSNKTQFVPKKKYLLLEGKGE